MATCHTQGLVVIVRVTHRYGETHGVPKMDNMGVGTVVDFDTLQYTIYPYCSVAGIHR